MISLRINPRTREIQADGQIILGTKLDVKSECISFEMENIENFDFSNCTIKINYKNALREKN